MSRAHRWRGKKNRMRITVKGHYHRMNVGQKLTTLDSSEDSDVPPLDETDEISAKTTCDRPKTSPAISYGYPRLIPSHIVSRNYVPCMPPFLKRMPPILPSIMKPCSKLTTHQNLEEIPDSSSSEEDDNVTESRLQAYYRMKDAAAARAKSATAESIVSVPREEEWCPVILTNRPVSAGNQQSSFTSPLSSSPRNFIVAYELSYEPCRFVPKKMTMSNYQQQRSHSCSNVALGNDGDISRPRSAKKTYSDIQLFKKRKEGKNQRDLGKPLSARPLARKQPMPGTPPKPIMSTCSRGFVPTEKMSFGFLVK